VWSVSGAHKRVKEKRKRGKRLAAILRPESEENDSPVAQLHLDKGRLTAKALFT
jgi:hypothetical protein